jgi:hypothetical protein
MATKQLSKENAELKRQLEAQQARLDQIESEKLDLRVALMVKQDELQRAHSLVQLIAAEQLSFQRSEEEYESH